MPRKGAAEEDDFRPGYKARAAKAEAAAAKASLQKAKEEADEAAKWQDGANARGAKRAAEQALKQAEKEAARKQKEDLLRQEEAIFGKSEKAKNRVAGKVASRHEERVSKDAIAFERYHAPELQARGIDAALAVMTIATQESGQSGDIAADMAAAEKIIRQQQTGVNVDDEHPEKRMKAAFERFKVRELPILREEFPRLRLSQYLEMVRKKWDKSPENPMYAAKLAKEKAEAEAKRTKDW